MADLSVHELIARLAERLGDPITLKAEPASPASQAATATPPKTDAHQSVDGKFDLLLDRIASLNQAAPPPIQPVPATAAPGPTIAPVNSSPTVATTAFPIV